MVYCIAVAMKQPRMIILNKKNSIEPLFIINIVLRYCDQFGNVNILNNTYNSGVCCNTADCNVFNTQTPTVASCYNPFGTSISCTYASFCYVKKN